MIFLVIGYLCGSSNMALYLSWFNKVDIMGTGTKNPGTSNAFVLMGPKSGVLVFLHDFLKGAFVMFLAQQFVEYPFAPVAVGVAAVLGHIFPLWRLGKRGGKGFATYIGVSLMLDFRIGLLILVLSLIIAVCTDYLVSATLGVVLFNPLVHILRGNPVIGTILIVATLLVMAAHWENYRKMRERTEPGLLKAILGKKKKRPDGADGQEASQSGKGE